MIETQRELKKHDTSLKYAGQLQMFKNNLKRSQTSKQLAIWRTFAYNTL